MKSTMIVEKVSNKFGPTFLVSDVWYIPDKKTNPSFEGIVPGSKVEVEYNSKWVQSVKIIGSDEVPQSTAKQAANAPSSPPKMHKEDSVRICRGNACNAIFSSPAVASLMEGKDISEGIGLVKKLVEQTASYIAYGYWNEPKES